MAESRVRNIFALAVLAHTILSACFFAAAPAGAASLDAAKQSRTIQVKEYPYYVEFRVAAIGVYGHTYIAYGRFDSLGRPATAAYADIHPTGGFASMVLGHFFPMVAATIPEKDTLGHKIASRFLRPLTAAEYARLTSVIARIRAARHAWSILAYNCNDFVADVARGMGMQTPATLALPYDFISRLQAMNEHRVRATSAAQPALRKRANRQSAFDPHSPDEAPVQAARAAR